MAIAYDASSSGLVVGATSLTFSHTCTGSNRILFVALYGDVTNDNVTGATYNGTAMTLANKVLTPSDRYVYMFYLIAPATGANNVVISASASIIMQGFSVSYTGAKQSGQPDNSNTNTATSGDISASVTSVLGGCWGVALIKSNVITPAGGTTIRVSDGGGTGMYDSNGPKTPAGTITLGLTGSNGNQAELIASFASDSTPYTLTAGTGAFTLTGVAALFTKALGMTSAVGAFTLTGIDALLKRGYGIVAGTGSFILTGVDTTFRKALNLIAGTGAFVLTGVAATFSRGIRMLANTGAFILTGNAVRFLFNGSSSFWSTLTKHVSSMSNTTKNSASMSNQSKNSSTWTNQSKS